MKKITFLFMLTGVFLNAQFTTPGNGTSYTLSSLSAAAPNILQNMGTHYLMTENITISATDKLTIDENTTLSVNADKALYVYGEYRATASDFFD